eukprot:gene10124-13608_t
MNYPPIYSLFLGDLSVFCTEQDIMSAFECYGEIADIKVMKSKETKLSLGYGFVRFYSYDNARYAMENMKNVNLLGRELRINWAQGNPPPPINATDLKSLDGSDVEEETCINDPSEVKGLFESALHCKFETVHKIKYVVDEGVLKEIFSCVGPVVSVQIKRYGINKISMNQYGYAFVHFKKTHQGISDALTCVRVINNVIIDNVRYSCSPSKVFKVYLANNARKYAPTNDLIQKHLLKQILHFNPTNVALLPDDIETEAETRDSNYGNNSKNSNQKQGLSQGYANKKNQGYSSSSHQNQNQRYPHEQEYGIIPGVSHKDQDYNSTSHQMFSREIEIQQDDYSRPRGLEQAYSNSSYQGYPREGEQLPVEVAMPMPLPSDNQTKPFSSMSSDSDISELSHTISTRPDTNQQLKNLTTIFGEIRDDSKLYNQRTHQRTHSDTGTTSTTAESSNRGVPIKSLSKLHIPSTMYGDNHEHNITKPQNYNGQNHGNLMEAKNGNVGNGVPFVGLVNQYQTTQAIYSPVGQFIRHEYYYGPHPTSPSPSTGYYQQSQGSYMSTMVPQSPHHYSTYIQPPHQGNLYMNWGHFQNEANGSYPSQNQRL